MSPTVMCGWVWPLGLKAAVKNASGVGNSSVAGRAPSYMKVVAGGKGTRAAGSEGMRGLGTNLQVGLLHWQFGYGKKRQALFNLLATWWLGTKAYSQRNRGEAGFFFFMVLNVDVFCCAPVGRAIPGLAS